jgi:Hypervirulence associated proteins TUDOR domain
MLFDFNSRRVIGATFWTKLYAVRTLKHRVIMTDNFKIGDRVSWNSEAGRVSGAIIRVHTRAIDVKGYTHHASADVPQYEIKSAKTDHIAFHNGSALRKLRG